MGASAQVATAEHQQSWAEQLGLSEDQWQRYLVGFHQDQGLARKAACASKVPSHPPSLPAALSRVQHSSASMPAATGCLTTVRCRHLQAGGCIYALMHVTEPLAGRSRYRETGEFYGL